MSIDTLEYVRKLEAAGVDRKPSGREPEGKQAEAHADAIRDTLTPQLATKSDLDTAVARLEAKMAEMEARLLRYMVGQTVLIAGIVFALMRLVK